MKKVVVGMSGGVDSSVAALLLKNQGYDVMGVTMQLWQDEDRCTMEENGGCCGLSAVEDAKRVCACIGIPHYVMNFKQEFRRDVIDYFTGEYLKGHTPNPCIACNRYLKWQALYERSLTLGADYIATGHYARIHQKENGRYTIYTSETAAKDQTYVLYNLTQKQLSHTLMPIGEYEKDKVRQIAEEAGLPVAHKKDSQDICFVPDGDYAGFLERELGKKNLPPEGDFVDLSGKVLGRHKGIFHYTIGQRKGLGIALGEPAFVVRIDAEKNQVIIGKNSDVFTNSLRADRLNFMAEEYFSTEKKYMAKIRYSDPGSFCRVQMTGEDEMELSFPEKVRAVTPGQAAVLYNEEGEIVGGGTIL